jgi:single-strand DNA-binding protein
MANFNYNKVIIGGRLTADPELKQTQSGVSVCSFTVAVNRRFQSKTADAQQTDFINVVAWRQGAELVSRYFRKGSSICVTGSIQTRKYQDKDGNNRVSTEVVADEISFVDSKGESSASQGGFGSPYAPENYAPSFSSQDEAAPQFQEMSGEDDLPF